MTEIQQQATEAVISKIATAAQYGGASGAVIFGLKANEFAAVIGAAVALLGFLVGWYFQRRRDRREQAEHEMRMRGAK